MKLIIIMFLLTSMNITAQITITAGDFNSMFSVGNEISLKENDTGGSVNIGLPGGGNTWDFSWFTGNLTMEIKSINPSTAPHIAEFPGANIVTYSVGDYQGDLGEIWTYSSLNASFDNHGAGIKLDSQPNDLFIIKHEPARIEAALPLTINSTWSQSYTQTIFYNGTPFLTSQVSQSVIADAYGTMTIPGGESFEALRIRETMTVNSITSVSYLFLTKSGAQVSVYAADPNPPTSGVIAAEGYSWNSSFSSGSGGSVFTFPPDYTMIAGEVDSIMYGEGLWNTELDLYFRTEKEGEFSLIESGYQSSDGKYYWDVPDSLLTTKANIKIVKTQDTTFQIISDQIKIKPWQLTRITNDAFELYEPDQDGWSFCNCGFNQWPSTWWNQFNYQTGIDPFTNQNYPQSTPFDSANASDFPNWELFVDVFSVEACYIESNGQLNYRSAATSFWGSNIGNWGGSCAGFSVTSLMGYYHRQDLSNYIGPFNNLFDFGLNDEARYTINVFQTHQYGRGARSHRSIGLQKSARTLLEELKEMLRKSSGGARTLDYYNNNGSGGHAVVPYKLERIGNTSTFNIRLYNPNNPGSFNQFIYVDSVANSWSDSTNLNWGTGSTGCFLEREVSDFLDLPTYNRFQKKSSPRNMDGTSGLTIFNTPDAEVVITSASGEQIGYQDSIAFNNISDAVHIIPFTGSFHPPIGYDLPPDNYSIILNNYSTSSSKVLFYEELTMYDYIRYNVNNNETDLFRYSENGVIIVNPDNQVKNLELRTIILEDSTSEKVFITKNIGVSENDSINIKEKDRSELFLNNYGSAKNYVLRIIDLSENGQFVFEHSSISISQNSGHQLVPDWSDLQNAELKILIDFGNDGTIDDSMFVKNQATSIEDEGSLLSPNNYNLAQNYPNPFNPVTTIKYSIPESGNVSLKVYDILGNEVATLVNVEKARGIHSVTFNAGNLSSGVYFYKIQAGSYSSTRKMMLLK